MTTDSLKLDEISADLAAHADDRKLHLFAKLLTPGLHQRSKNPQVKSIDDFAATYVTNDRVNLTEMFVNSTLQPGDNDTFDPTDNAWGLRNRFASVQAAKIDLIFKKTKVLNLYKTYYGMVKGGKYDPEKLPFEEYITSMIIEKSQSDLRNSLWNATHNPTGNTPLDLFDGWKKQINEAIVSGEIGTNNVLINGGVTVANIIDETEELIGMIPDEYLYHDDMICLCSGAFARTYWKGFSDKYPSAPFNDSYTKTHLLGTEIEMCVEPSLKGFNFPIFTLKNNLAYLYDDESAQTDLQVDYDKRTRSIAFVADFQAGAGIAMPSLIWTMK